MEALRELAFELSRGHAGLILSLRVDNVSYGLRLSEVYAPVRKGAKSKLARLRDSRAASGHHLKHAA
jgi:hypothetical protein